MSTTTPDDARDARQLWKEWRERRHEKVSAPYGPLALTGTHWLADHPDGRLPGIPGHWTSSGSGGSGGGVLLTAAEEDGLRLDGEPRALDGQALLGADGTPATARVALGDRRLLVMRREGLWAVRDFDPRSAARRAFAGIDAFDHDARWVREGRFRPYGRGTRTVTVENADGKERGLSVAGELSFTLGGESHVLHAGAEGDGSLWVVFADATSGVSSYRFRFLYPSVPDEEGRVVVDFNRALLPPCAFADHFICPFPPVGNALPVAVEAGERFALTR
ncbi:DUF1684 domain-containing protein [Streptomyces sp. AV19]|uniref:DUF1684 domain-containing protein n=1 Tax=Streptomyces sp. AV19 TaxID=2793068 RepID=UPI0018FE9E3E|nr:DUF1684 domain-containing protein [Streptomyces sp. AV19]MBH1936577.1 DUF1684 domain-containing protein [Streptomyces sp. AV19]MDG4532636.1 DUF1684 domain-containing protein [Streptomyces sp. AV19]